MKVEQREKKEKQPPMGSFHQDHHWLVISKWREVRAKGSMKMKKKNERDPEKGRNLI